MLNVIKIKPVKIIKKEAPSKMGLLKSQSSRNRINAKTM
jgi:hypothetical protein